MTTTIVLRDRSELTFPHGIDYEINPTSGVLTVNNGDTSTRHYAPGVWLEVRDTEA